jgi:hypothetical protein
VVQYRAGVPEASGQDLRQNFVFAFSRVMDRKLPVQDARAIFGSGTTLPRVVNSSGRVWEAAMTKNKRAKRGAHAPLPTFQNSAPEVHCVAASFAC